MNVKIKLITKRWKCSLHLLVAINSSIHNNKVEKEYKNLNMSMILHS